MATTDHKCPGCDSNWITTHGRTRREAERKAEWRKAQGHLCRDCQQAERNAKRAAAAATARERGLPALQGTRPQCEWAEEIRLARIDALADSQPLTPDDLLSIAMGEITSAEWWIDNRDTHPDILRHTAEVRKHSQPLLHQPSLAEAEAKAEALLQPADPVTPTLAHIRADGHTLIVRFDEKRADFRAAIRDSLQFSWDSTFSHWSRRTSTIDDNMVDRLAETAHGLIDAGFSVQLYNPAAQALAISGDFNPEHRHWIDTTPDNGYVKIVWPAEDEFEYSAGAIHGCRTRYNGATAPAASYDEIEDFAACYGFIITAAAAERLTAAREHAENGYVIDAPKRRTPVEIDHSTPALDVREGGIDESLLDHD